MWFLKEFWDFLKERKKYWLFPILFILLIFGTLIVLSQGSVVAPFIYTTVIATPDIQYEIIIEKKLIETNTATNLRRDLILNSYFLRFVKSIR